MKKMMKKFDWISPRRWEAWVVLGVLVIIKLVLELAG